MLVLLSPAKTLNFDCEIPAQIEVSTPIFQEETSILVKQLKKYSASDLSKLMSLSPKLAELNYQRFQNFDSNSLRPAIYAYNGDVYEGFELSEYNQDLRDFANRTLRIISGLYGVLKPFDLIKPYRLEMSISLPNNLYDFWKGKLTDKLNSEADQIIINLASQEYSSAIDSNKLKKKKIDIVFKEKHQDGYKIIAIHTKKARGVMANFIIRNMLNSLEDLKKFKENGYKYSQEFSSEEEYVFLR